jgi:hypothetical protein
LGQNNKIIGLASEPTINIKNFARLANRDIRLGLNRDCNSKSNPHGRRVFGVGVAAGGKLWLYRPYSPGETITLESIEWSCTIEQIYEEVQLYENIE